MEQRRLMVAESVEPTQLDRIEALLRQLVADRSRPVARAIGASDRAALAVLLPKVASSRLRDIVFLARDLIELGEFDDEVRAALERAVPAVSNRSVGKFLARCEDVVVDGLRVTRGGGSDSCGILWSVSRV